VQNYLSWEELDEEQPILAGNVEEAGGVQSQLAVLMRERAGLEEHMLRLLGKAPQRPDEAREQARFPMPIHTPESRMEDRRIARENERARAAARRALEAARIRAEEERQHHQRKRDREREVIQQQIIQYADSLRKVERQQERARASLAEELIRNRWAEQREAARRARDEARRQEWILFEQRSVQGRETAMERYRARRDDDAEF
jgi:hypothetical protein